MSNKTTTKEILTLDFPFFKKVYPLACEVHKDQARKDGKPYMSHIDAVIEGAYDLALQHNEKVRIRDIFKYNKFFYSIDEVLSVAALHDSIEDHPDKISLGDITKALLLPDYPSEQLWRTVESITKGVSAITKKPKGEEKYSDYVCRVFSNTEALIVKISDLEHNTSDLKPGNMLDKYQLTHYVLSLKLSDL